MKLGFQEDAAMNITRNLFGSIDGISQYEVSGFIGFGNSREDAAIRQLKSTGANWKRAEITVSSEEYWENYFAHHPRQRPKHIIFYNGDPTSAIYEFKEKNNIGQADVSQTEGKLLGFDDRHIADMQKDSRAHPGYDELIETAHRVIASHYAHTPT